jgi:RimJ/RimL family protein N-acetyltransferase
MAPFITVWERSLHLQNLTDPDKRYLLALDPDGGRMGYAILAGLASPDRSVELARIALTEPGQGRGREFLRLIKELSFGELKAHRLWLDVFPENQRAQRAYLKAGFKEEGLLREAYLHGGRFRSLIIMSILEVEYRAGALQAGPT